MVVIAPINAIIFAVMDVKEPVMSLAWLLALVIVPLVVNAV